ncbi:LUD domain-containing protein [Patulibacter sp.]|uniref:LutC/YkgG family protein n=1 Tax=Patulibacter sp. TaxID=1912859 RepID=UPI002726BF1D|nr:LUD domain-containing protein [Patulibacter sp.]MDO9407455.1 LUD domain-containing protein [Patulibacter sp.]
MSGRDQVLAKVRAALQTAERGAGPDGPRPVPAPGRRTRPDAWDADELADRFAERVDDYRATVVRTGPDGVGAAVAAALADLDPGTVAAPAGLPAAWRPDDALDGSVLRTAELPAVSAVVTACRLAIAETGTIVLDHADDQGPRRLTLVPDRHVCVVRTEQIVDDVDDAFAAMSPADHGPPGPGTPPLTFVSGPSATSDIELQRVEGVHGPRTLVVIVVGPG